MSAGSNILKNFTLFIETYGYAGNIDELQLPSLKIKTEEHRAGGMDAPMDIDMGMEKLETNFTLTSIDSLAQSALGQTVKNVSMTARGCVQDANGTEEEVVIKMTGKCTSFEPGAWKPGEKPKDKYTFSLIYYHRIQGGKPLHVIDVPNMVRMIGGIDQLAGQRNAIQAGQGITPTLRNIIGV